MLNPAAVETHQHEVLKLGVHRNALILLRRAAHVNAVLCLALRNNARRPPRDHARRAVHRRHDLAADLAQLRVGQPPHPVHERVQLLDQARDGRDVGRHLERPVLPVLAALVEVLSVGAVARDHVERFAQDEVLERQPVHDGRWSGRRWRMCGVVWGWKGKRKPIHVFITGAYQLDYISWITFPPWGSSSVSLASFLFF